MAQFSVKAITGASVTVNGQVLHGLVKEVEVSPPKHVMADYTAVGMWGKKQIPVGMDQMEGSLKLNHFQHAQIDALVNPFAPVMMQIRTNSAEFGGASVANVAVVWKLTVWGKQSMHGLSYKAQEIPEFDYEFAVDSIDVVVNNQSRYKFDVNANIFTINGVSVIDSWKNTLGI